MRWAWLSRAWRSWRSALHVVKPETVVAWHRHSFRLFWTWKSRRRTGRPGVPTDVRALIRELSTANPLWGAPRTHGELQKLGISVSQSTVAKFMRRHPRPPSQTWRTFLTNHASQLMAADLFVVPTVTFRLLFVLVILGRPIRTDTDPHSIDGPSRDRGRSARTAPRNLVSARTEPPECVAPHPSLWEYRKPR
jgi:putative transposase